MSERGTAVVAAVDEQRDVLSAAPFRYYGFIDNPVDVPPDATAFDMRGGPLSSRS